MSQIPDRSSVITSLFNSVAGNPMYDIRTHDGCGRFIELAQGMLHKEDQNWMLLKKNPGQNQYNGHGVDVLFYVPSRKTVDLVSSSASPDARIGWMVNEGDDYGPEKAMEGPTQSHDDAPHSDAPQHNDAPPQMTSMLEHMLEKVIENQMLQMEATQMLIHHAEFIMGQLVYIRSKQDRVYTGSIKYLGSVTLHPV